MKKEDLTISPKTQALIECLDSANQLWEQVSAALSYSFKESTVYEIMDEHYNEAHYQLKDAIGKLIIQSIESNIGIVDSNKI